jgi:hypothetical protein
VFVDVVREVEGVFGDVVREVEGVFGDVLERSRVCSSMS